MMRSLLKIEFDTVRQLEKKSFRLFAYSGGAFVAGCVLTLAALPFVGIPLIVLSAIAILGIIAVVSMLGKEASKQMFCPYCSSRNDVYQSRKDFDCDICGRPVHVSENGEPIMAQQIDTEARYDRPSSR